MRDGTQRHYGSGEEAGHAHRARHGACPRSLGDAAWRACLLHLPPSDAEDVFQETFLKYALHDRTLKGAAPGRATAGAPDASAASHADGPTAGSGDAAGAGHHGAHGRHAG